MLSSASMSKARSRFTALAGLRAGALQRLSQQPWWSDLRLWVIVVTVLGLALRFYHFLANPPVWHDEAALIANVLHKDFGEILGPMFYCEACPPLFLAAEKLIVLGLGDGTFALRLLPFLASCISLVSLVFLASRVLPRTAWLWFALLLACSDRLLFHGSEAKPYAVDVLVATSLLALLLAKPKVPACEVEHCRRLLFILAVLSPVLIFLSFPACFMLGGAALTLLPEVWRQRSRLTWALYCLFGALLCGAFLTLYFTAIQAQKNDSIVSCWIANFPPWDRPWLVPAMAAVRLTEVFRYAADPIGNLLAILAVIGAVSWWKQRRRRLLGVFLWPLVLNLAAWLMSAYPFGAQRVVVYAVPAALLLITAGIAPALAWLSRWGPWTRLALVALLLIPVGQTAAVILVRPWKRLDSATPTAFVLANRQSDEPVVGTWWEQAYYCRELGDMYRALAPAAADPPTVPSAVTLDANGCPTTQAVSSLWLLIGHVPADHTMYMLRLQPAGRWRVVAEYPFRDVTVLHISRE